MNIWFYSDPHYWQKNIAGSKVSCWKGGYRNFEDEKEMSRQLVKTFNQHVKYDDIVYCMGDWSFGGIQNIWNFRKQLECNTIHLMLGNHDHHIRANNDIDCDGQLKCCKQLFSSVQDVLTVQHGQHKFFLSHYAHRVWEGSHKGVIHLYGHSHNTIADFNKSMDVGVDVAYARFGEYRPFHIDEIIQIMNKKQIIKVDRH